MDCHETYMIHKLIVLKSASDFLQLYFHEWNTGLFPYYKLKNQILIYKLSSQITCELLIYEIASQIL